MISQCQTKQRIMNCIQFTGKNFKHLAKVLGNYVSYEKGKPYVKIDGHIMSIDKSDWVVVDGDSFRIMPDEMFYSMFDIV